MTSPRIAALAYAHFAAGKDVEAERLILAGLALAPEDALLVDLSGDLPARRDRSDEPRARWEEAVRLDPENLTPRYSRAALLERLGRLERAAAEWRQIVSWCDSRGYVLDAERPQRELGRSRSAAQRLAEPRTIKRRSGPAATSASVCPAQSWMRTIWSARTVTTIEAIRSARRTCAPSARRTTEPARGPQCRRGPRPRP
jgi:predicted Zn-dependent protease